MPALANDPRLRLRSSGTRLEPLVSLAAHLGRVPAQNVERLATALLASPQRADVPRWCSSLNNDGSPLQLAVTLAARSGRPSVRLIADPASEDAAAQHRWARGQLALAVALASHAPRIADVCDTLIDRMLPRSLAERAALPGAAIWVAADLAGKGMALYATAKWGGALDRWTRTQDWLRNVMPVSAASRLIIERLADQTSLVSVGIEGSSPDNARVKLYWRLREGASLSGLGVQPFCIAPMREFLFDVVGDRRISLAAFVGSVGFRLGDGELSDVKLDVCGHCVRRDTAEWLRVIGRTVMRHELAPLFLDVAATAGTELAFIGLGVDRALSPRLNVYFKPCA